MRIGWAGDEGNDIKTGVSFPVPSFDSPASRTCDLEPARVLVKHHRWLTERVAHSANTNNSDHSSTDPGSQVLALPAKNFIC